jgi:hypothetical protein
MYISVASVTIPSEVLISYLVPPQVRNRYKVSRVGVGEFFEVKHRGSVVAVIQVKDGFFDIAYLGTPSSKAFQAVLESEYLTRDELFWLVLYPDSIYTWTFSGTPQKTKKQALDQVTETMTKGMCILVSYLRPEWSRGLMRVRSAQYLKGTWPLVDAEEEDMGSVAFRVSDYSDR